MSSSRAAACRRVFAPSCWKAPTPAPWKPCWRGRALRGKNEALAGECLAAAPPAEQVGSGPGWALVGLLPKVADPEFRNLVLEMGKRWRAAAVALESSNPYGVCFPATNSSYVSGVAADRRRSPTASIGTTTRIFQEA